MSGTRSPASAGIRPHHGEGAGKAKGSAQPQISTKEVPSSARPGLGERGGSKDLGNGYGEKRHSDPPKAQGLSSKPAFPEGSVENKTGDEPSEATLLRDLPFTLQGLSSTNLPFTSNTTLQLPSTLPLPMVSILHTLAEPSLLYRSLSEFVQSRDEGLVGQSLRSAIGNELRSYLGLIATLEGEIRRAIKDTESSPGVRTAGVTLKRCVVWTRDATMGLRLMSVMAEESKSMLVSPGQRFY